MYKTEIVSMKDTSQTPDAKKVKFKPYNLRDYKLYFEPDSKYHVLGGLGPNKDQKFSKANAAAMKMKSFSEAVRKTNLEKPQNALSKMLRTNKEKKVDSRSKALEFANKIKEKFRKSRSVNAHGARNADVHRGVGLQGETFDRLPMYKKDLKFEQEAINMFYK